MAMEQKLVLVRVQALVLGWAQGVLMERDSA